MPAVIVIHCLSHTHTRTELCPSTGRIHVDMFLFLPLPDTHYPSALSATNSTSSTCTAALQRPQADHVDLCFVLEMLTHTHTHTQSSERSDTQTDRQADGEQRQRLCAGTDLKSWSWCSRSSTDLRLPWLDRERGSCFMHGQKESSEREGDAPSLNCGGRSHRPQRQISIMLCKGGGRRRGEGGRWMDS